MKEARAAVMRRERMPVVGGGGAVEEGGGAEGEEGVGCGRHGVFWLKWLG